MPKRTDIKSILIIGAGPIVIGQACEFDYSGVQACKALKEEGYRVILVNSNPATIMTDPSTADRTYIEPLTWEIVEKVIAAERPDALLPTLGGQTALNLAMDLEKHGILVKYGADHLDVVLVEHAFAREIECAVERGLAAHGRQQRIRAFDGDDLGHHGPGDGLDVGHVGHVRIGHDRRRIGVHQDDPIALLLEGLHGLGSRVVELGTLADYDRPGTDEQNGR